MKQCPVCKAEYIDESLSFCLNDGASLFLVQTEEQPTQIRAYPNNQVRIPIEREQPKTSEPVFFNQPVAAPPPRQSGSKTTFVITALAALFLLLIAGAVAAYLLAPRGDDKAANNSKTPTPTSSAKTGDDETNELKEKVANLEKELQNQKKTPNQTPTVSMPQTPPTVGTSARVNSPGDGFLALRTAPDADLGERITKIPHGASVVVYNCRNYATIAGRRGRWCQVEYAGLSGWAFDAWLDY